MPLACHVVFLWLDFPIALRNGTYIRLILSFGIVQSFVFARVTCADDLLGAVRKDVCHLTGGLTVFPMAMLIGLRLIPLGLLVALILRQLLIARTREFRAVLANAGKDISNLGI